MEPLLLLLIAPLLAATSLLFLTPGKASSFLTLTSLFAQVATASYLALTTYFGNVVAYQVGGWPAPFGISLACDFLSSSFLLVSTFTAFACTAYFLIEQKDSAQMQLKLPLLQLLFFGVNLSFLTADLFNLFVAFEVMLMSSYALMGIEANRKQTLCVMPYVGINLTASMLFLTFAGIVYSYTGSLNMAHLAQIFSSHKEFPLTYAACGAAFVIFGVKAGCFPLYFWLPHSYPILPSSLAAIFGGILTKVGFYVLFRLFVSVFPQELSLIHSFALYLGGTTMLLGVLGAIAQNSIRGILSYHIISQMGYMIMALGLYTPVSLAGALFFALHNMIVKSSLFLAGGVGRKAYGTDSLYKVGDLSSLVPYASAIFLLQALSLAGLPPFSGFWGKLLMISSAVEASNFFATFLFISIGFLTLFSMMKIWTKSFWGRRHSELKEPPCKKLSSIAWGLAALSFAMALFAGPLAENFISGAKLLLEKKAYREAILPEYKEEM